MSRDEFRAALGRLGITQVEFGRIADAPRSTIRDWSARGTPGGPVDVLLGLLERHPDLISEMQAAQSAAP